MKYDSAYGFEPPIVCYLKEKSVFFYENITIHQILSQQPFKFLYHDSPTSHKNDIFTYLLLFILFHLFICVSIFYSSSQ